MIISFVLVTALLLAPIPFLKAKRHRRSLVVMAALVLGLLVFTMAVSVEKRSEILSVALFFGLLGWFRLAGEFDARGPKN